LFDLAERLVINSVLQILWIYVIIKPVIDLLMSMTMISCLKWVLYVITLDPGTITTIQGVGFLDSGIRFISSGVDQPAAPRRRVRNNTNPNPPPSQPHQTPPAGMEQFLAAQTQLLTNMANTIANMQAQMNQAPPPPPPPARDRHREFMSPKPPTFSHSPDPLQADDWIKTVDKMLNLAQCTDREKVLYASGRLEGTTADWWDAYTAAHDNPDAISWQEFRSKFREQHIPKGLMKLKK
jgi:hypothetical protein